LNLDVPRISSFYGIDIYLYYDDHLPPRFHAQYAEFSAKFRIDTLECMDGRFPGRATALVLEWSYRHRDALMANWDKAHQGLPLDTIPPLG
jgi:hypothetical protein